MRRRGLVLDEAEPLRRRQHAIGVRILLQTEAALLVARLAGAALPVQQTGELEVDEATGGAADADAGFAGNRLIGRFKPSGRVVEKVEQQRVQHGEAISA